MASMGVDQKNSPTIRMMFDLHNSVLRPMDLAHDYLPEEMVLDGHPSKNIAFELGISQRTVEKHRASIMSRTEAKSIPELARIALAAGEKALSAAGHGKGLTP